MIEEPVAEADQHPASMDSHLRDRMIESLDHDRALREGEDPEERFGWERERSVYDARGSYAELRYALARMRGQWPPGHRQIARVYFWGLQFQLTFEDQFLLDAAEEWIARSMRGPVRVPPWLAENHTIKRERTVESLASEGMSAGQIARALRIPKQKVKRLLVVSGSSDILPLAAEPDAAPGEPERVRV
jgi:hypothetical protein